SPTSRRRAETRRPTDERPAPASAPGRDGRSYRSAAGRGVAELRRCAGTQFDPELVERAIEVITARDRGERPGTVPDSVEAVLALGLATERLGSALGAEDLTLLTAMAERLEAVAARYEWSDITELATTLTEAVVEEGDLAALLQTTRDLLRLCHSAQDAILSRRDSSPRRGAAA
ncbi:MAG: hypothetical protein ACYTG1_09885, partial [Planctomycetota bacterium]